MCFEEVLPIWIPNFGPAKYFFFEFDSIRESKQIRNLINFLSKSTYSSNIKLILIDNAEFLNLNSSNANIVNMVQPQNKRYKHMNPFILDLKKSFVRKHHLKQHIINIHTSNTGMDVTIAPERVNEIANKATSKLNSGIVELRRLFLVENMMDSIKFGLSLWVLTYIGR